MIGSADRSNAPSTSVSSGVQRYVAVDGGAGAMLLAALAGRHPAVQQVFSPRHANLLIVVTPINRQLAPALREFARALPRPARALVVGMSGLDHLRSADLVPISEVLTNYRQTLGSSVESVLDRVLAAGPWLPLAVRPGPGLEAVTIPLPSREEREMATELVVFSLGPIQPCTAGPLRLLLTLDGSQVLSVRVEKGFARRGIAEGMLGVGWREAVELAGSLDPLAPLAGRLACVRAIEEIQGYRPPPAVVAHRDAALALERAANWLWWSVRFGVMLAAGTLVEGATTLANRLDQLGQSLWIEPPTVAIAPRTAPTLAMSGSVALAELRRLADETARFRLHEAADRLLALRTRGLGVVSSARLHAAGVSGPVLQASERGVGDVHGRLLIRLAAAAQDLRQASDLLSQAGPLARGAPSWEVPVGMAQVTVDGPRGQIGLQMESAGGDGPARVAWQRPSAALLALVPDLLAGQHLADAEVILASLDLSMAEADG